MLGAEVEAFLASFSKDMEEGTAAVFVGAGLSKSAGFVDWKSLLAPIARDIGLDVEKEHDLLALAQYHCNERGGNRNRLTRRLVEEFSRSAELTESHRILAGLPIATFWTTNYDKLLEKALEEAGKRVDMKSNSRQLTYTLPKRNAIVYKMHGDIDDPSDVVLTKDDYDRYAVERRSFLESLSTDLCSKSFLFIGFSFLDPNLNFILRQLRLTYGENQREHYALFKKTQPRDYNTERDFRYEERKQELIINDLKRTNIVSLLLDDYGETRTILDRLRCYYADLERSSHKARSVLISGAAYEYGGGWPTKRAHDFLRGLALALVRHKYRIVSGLGYGLSTAIIHGINIYIHSMTLTDIRNYLVLRPFPGEIIGTAEWEATARRYREDMAEYAGAAVFLFGNKRKDGQVVLSDGVGQEFAICKEKGLAVIPVGATGSMAGELWTEVMADFATYFPKRTEEFRPLMQTLGDTGAEPQVLIDTVVRVLELWTQG